MELTSSEPRFTSVKLTLMPTAAQARCFARHGGAARLAFNRVLGEHIRIKRANRERPEGSPSQIVPYGKLGGIDAFNKWKKRTLADDPEHYGWLREMFQLVLEEASKDAGEALNARRQWYRDNRKGRCPGHARFKKKGRSRVSFRIRNKSNEVRFRPTGTASDDASAIPARAVQLPAKLGGVVRLREDTRKLRRLLAKPETRLWFATIALDQGRWTLTVNLQTDPLHPATQVASEGDAVPVGIDLGLQTFAVLATAESEEVERLQHPRPLRRALDKLRRDSRALSRKKKGSKNRDKARRRLQSLHARLRNVRHDFVRRHASRLAQTHSHLVVETLSFTGLVRTRRGIARGFADSAAALFLTKLKTRVGWHGGQLTEAHRHFPSTRRCSACGHVGDRVPLGQRTFHCSRCGFEADRDTNAAINLGQYPGLPLPTSEKPSGS
ncbi:MAG: RNA-guided endonuclease TnpB family protein [Myxococcota bacterium]